MSRIRIVPILVIMSIALSVLFGGWELYRNFGLVAPLEKQLADHEAVRKVETVVKGQEREIHITLNQVDDLQDTFVGVQDVVQQSLGKQATIKLVDNRQDELKDAYQAIQPTLYAGVAQGDFPEMISDVQKQAVAAGLNSKITMNDEFIFVQLEKADQYLYEVLPYQSTTAIRTTKGVTTL